MRQRDDGNMLFDEIFAWWKTTYYKEKLKNWWYRSMDDSQRPLNLFWCSEALIVFKVYSRVSQPGSLKTFQEASLGLAIWRMLNYHWKLNPNLLNFEPPSYWQTFINLNIQYGIPMLWAVCTLKLGYHDRKDESVYILAPWSPLQFVNIFCTKNQNHSKVLVKKANLPLYFPPFQEFVIRNSFM